MIYWLYGRMLMRQLHDLPGHVCFMISGEDMADAPENLYHITRWCTEISAVVAKQNPSARRNSGVLPFTLQPVPPVPWNPISARSGK